MQRDFLEGVVVDVDGAFIEVGSVEVTIAIESRARETGVAGAVRGLNHDHGVRGGRRGAGSDSDGWVPSGDGAVNGGEEKIGGCARSQEKVRGTGVGDGARGSAIGKGLTIGVGLGNRYDQRVDGSSAVIQRAQASTIV